MGDFYMENYIATIKINIKDPHMLKFTVLMIDWKIQYYEECEFYQN